jgi:hypothetical protein
MHRQPESIFLSSREHDVTRAPRGSGDGISWVDGIGDAAAVPQRTICASPTSSDSSAAIGPAAFARKSAAVPPIDRAASTRVEDLARDPPRGSSTRLRATAGNRRNRTEHT